MSERGKVHPGCVNASNPYHQCVEECYRKIAGGKPHKSKNQSDYRGAGEERSKIVQRERRVNGACPKASNPYHECGESCSQKGAHTEARRYKKEAGSNGVDASQTLSRRTKKDPDPRPNSSHMQDKVTRPVVSTTSTVAPSSPLHHTSEKRHLEDNNSISPIPYSGEIHPEDFSFLKGQVRSSPSMPTSGNVTPVLHLSPDRAKGPPMESLEYAAKFTPSKEIEEENFNGTLRHEIVPSTVIDDPAEGAPHSNRGSMSSSISDVGHSFEDSDDEDVQSVMSETRVPVGKYHVKSSMSSILQAILEKYGDIAENCVLESISMRSYYLESVCFVVQELQSTSFMHLTKSKVKEMLAILKDLETSHIKVGWLRKILDEISEVIEVITQHQTVKAAKTKCDQGLESMKILLEFQTEDLATKEAELAEAKSKLAETRNRLRELEVESSELNKSVLSLSSQVDGYHFKSLLEELL
ncbi:uncharacterized protein LOC115672640 [Syzygium oleosum]|uniref:uncharacterized protein LOC115672640 n=1 Tax=Syzygium oleosum TaxID=219896 RepID=UPI0024BB096C|nr:uncharacterized protein LOC115672640 [Syzygium oleosum]